MYRLPSIHAASSPLEIQGDHLERLRGLLGEIGYRVRG